MNEVSTIGFDLAKSVFQVHGVDCSGEVAVRRQLRRGQVLGFFAKHPRCLVGMEACATAHHWARQLRALGHEVRLIPPGYVKAYVRRGKNDAADAAAICEAVGRPSMRFVAVKSAEQQGALMLHRARELLIGQRTQLINALRGHLAELGIVTRRGPAGVQELVRILAQGEEHLPAMAVGALAALARQLSAVGEEIAALERQIHDLHRASEASRRLQAIPGIGVLGATALAASVTDAGAFKSGRAFAASLGLVPRQHSSGGKQRLGAISKQGDRYLRRLLISGAMAVVRHARTRPDKHPWLTELLARRPAKVVAVALANKMARVAWALLARGQTYRAPALAAPAAGAWQ
jgi:transposase